jgi:hypothetical protein
LVAGRPDPDHPFVGVLQPLMTRARAFLRIDLGGPRWSHTNLQGKLMSLGTILLIVLIIALLGGFSGIGGGPFYGTGYYGGGGLGLVIVILLILVLLGKI